MKAPLKTTLKDGQRYVDEPVYREIGRATPLALSINAGLRSLAPSMPAPNIQPRIRELSHYERVQLRWMRPDGKGGLVPRDEK